MPERTEPETSHISDQSTSGGVVPGGATQTGPGTEASDQQAAYFAKRSLKQGTAGWVLLAGLGVSYVISGDYSGWNYGLAHGGWGGQLIAFILMGIMYLFMVLGLAEMSSSLPTAGAGYGFARRAMGKTGGYLTGIAVLIEYTMTAAAISLFISGYVEALGIFPNFNPVWVVLAFYIVFTLIHIIGVGEALTAMLVITVIAILTLVVFAFGVAPAFSTANLFDIVSDGSLLSSSFLPHGIVGLMATLPFGMWCFLGIEGVPLAAEEARDPKKDMPRGIITAIVILIMLGMGMLLLAPGSAGSALIGASDSPTVDALNAVGRGGLARFVNIVGLAGLIASFFSMMFGYSRQLFALSRAGYLPRCLSMTTSRKTPALALVIPGAVGCTLACVVQTGSTMLDVAVFGATVSYAMMSLSHIILRRREPDMPRAYRTPGGVVTTGIATVLACIAVVATFFVDIKAAGITAAVLVCFLLYYLLYSRKHLVTNAPEEEFSEIEESLR